MPALITRWTMDARALSPRAGADVVERVGADLLARWAEPVRCYHTTTHLVEMFGALEELEDAGEIDDRECSVARLAAWFHDSIYDPLASPGSNESDSAVLARDAMHELSLATDDIDAIARLIQLTARHDTDATEPLDAAFHDADLWILSAPQDRFDCYCDQVRKEYAHVQDAAYRRGRADILRPLMHRDRIYRTSHALGGWETPAQINLGRELTRLRADS